MGCSIKLVSQRDGKDLDPNFLKYRPRGQGGGDNRSMPLGAAAGHVKAGAVVDWGHLTGSPFPCCSWMPLYCFLLAGGLS